MDKILEALTDGLIDLRSKVKNNTEDIDKINKILSDIESNQIDKSEIEKLVILLATGYFKTKNDDYDTMINELMSKITADNEAKLTEMINQSIEAFKSDLTAFKGTIKNGKDGLNGRNGLDGKDGRNGLSGRDGKDGLNGTNGLSGTNGINGLDGVGISDITYKNGTLTITLSDGTKKNIKLNIPTQYIGGGGGVSAEYVDNAIAEALGGGGGTIDAYTKLETQTILPKVGFDTVNPLTPSLGQLAWNIDEGTLDLAMANATLQIGQETLVKVRNKSGATIEDGTVVMAVGTQGNSGRILVSPHTGLRSTAKQILGIATESILNNQDGFVTVFGKVRGINTTGSAVGETWVDGDILYIKPNDFGHLTKVAPLASEINMPIAIVINAHTNGALFVRISGIDENAFNDAQNLFIQDTQPTQTAPYMWVQTFENGDLTFWIEDGK
jgi:hypothetical protein